MKNDAARRFSVPALRFFSTVRWRLTLWYVLIFFISSLLLGAAVVRLVQRSFLAEVDRSLQEEMAAVSRSIDSAYEEEATLPVEELKEEISELGLSSDTALIVDQAGQPESLINAEYLPQAVLERQERAGDEPLTWQGPSRAWRWLGLRREVSGQFRYRVTLLRDLSSVEAELDQVKESLTLALIPLTLLSAAVGYFLAGRVLAPVDRIALKARRIEATGLGERLVVENPEDEFGRLAGVLNDLFGRLQHAFEQQRRFLTDAAHELRTPVAILRAQAEVALLDRSRSPEQYVAALESIAREVASLSELVDDLMLMARADASQSLALEPQDLGEVVEEACRALRPMAERKKVALLWELGEELIAWVDPRLTRRAMTNLLTNAIAYTPPEGAVSVELRNTEQGALVEVRDTGPGIAEEDLPRVFDRFFRGKRRSNPTGDDPSQSSPLEGCGLGLAIVKTIMDLHGGRATVRNLPDRGAAFTLTLPCGQSDRGKPPSA